MNRALLFFVAILLLFCGSAIVWVASRRPDTVGASAKIADATYVAPANPITEFEFTDQLGKTFGSKELAGKVWLGTFFFADCPSICVQQNTEVAKLHKRFAQDGVIAIDISVAPDKDPPHKLWTYANRFSADHDSWKFLTGKDIKYVKQVGADIFGLPAADETHTADVAVFDRSGKIVGTYNIMEGLEYAKCVKKIEELVAQDSSTAGEDGVVDPAVDAESVTATESVSDGA